MRRGAGIGEAWVLFHQGFLPVREPELAPQCGILERGTVNAVERPQQDRAAVTQEAVLLSGQESWTQDGTEGPIAEIQAAATQLAIQHRLGFAPHLIAQRLVIVSDRLLQHRPHAEEARLRVRPLKSVSQWNLRGVVLRLARPITRSAMCCTTHAKYSGVSELMSKSGAGFMKSIA